MISDLLEDFAVCLHAMPSKHASRRVIALLDKAFRRDAWFIDRHPTVLFQCGWNACWWHGFTGESQGAAPDASAQDASDLQLRQVMEKWRAEKQRATPGFPWLRSLRSSPEPLCSGLRFKAIGHRHFATCVAFSPDGRLLASGSGWYGGSDDWAIRLWKVEDGLPAMRLEGHGGWINGVTFSPTGKEVVSCSEDRTLRVWDVSTGRERHCVRFQAAAPSSIVFLPDGFHVAIGASDGKIEVRNVETWRVTMRLRQHGDEVHRLVCSAQTNQLVSLSRDGEARLWDIDTGVELPLDGLTGVVSSGVALSSDGSTLVTSGADGVIHVRNASTAEETVRWQGPADLVRCLDISPDGRMIASSSADLSVRLWDSETGRAIACFRGHGARVLDVRFAPDASVVASAAEDHSVRVWEVRAAESTPSCESVEADITAIAFSPESRVVAAGSNDGALRIWDATTGCERACLREHTEAVSAVAFMSHSGVFTGAADGTVRLWDWRMGRQIDCWSWPDARVRSVAVAPDGNQAAVGMEDGRVFAWDVRTGRVSHALITPEGPASDSDEPHDPEWPLPAGYPVNSLVFSRDGRHLVGAGRNIWRWDLGGDACGETLKQGGFRDFGRIAFTADGEYLVVHDSVEPTNTFLLAAATGADIPTVAYSGVGNPSTPSSAPTPWRPIPVYENGLSQEIELVRSSDDAVAFWLPTNGFVNLWAFSDDGLTFAYALMGYRSGGGHHLSILRLEGGSPKEPRRHE
jgi:WD40 repeat protein